MQVRANPSRIVFIDNAIGKKDASASVAPATTAAVQDCAGGAGGECGISNTALVSEERELLRFGLDEIVLYINGYNQESKVLVFLDDVFSRLTAGEPLPANPVSLSWPETSTVLQVTFLRKKGDEIAYFALEPERGKERVISVRRITPTSTFPASIRDRYHYQITFYGRLFALSILKPILVEDFLRVFLEDEENESLYINICQIHICADIQNINTAEILDGIQIVSKKHAKEISVFRINSKTGLPATVYYGRKSNSSWFVRFYNKLLEIQELKIERLYPQYWGISQLTRVELILKSQQCRTFDVTLERCLNKNFLLSLFSEHLDGKYVKWNVLQFVVENLEGTGFATLDLARTYPNYKLLRKTEAIQRLRNSFFACKKRYGISEEELRKLVTYPEEDSTIPTVSWI